ncbi:MAG TPA: DsbA family protein [Gammaproteobacteria bacterium]|nr:DsbA family protein [Gammaproteobacteria bacterium]
MANDLPQSIKVDIWSDFVSPFCFIASLRLEKLAQGDNLDPIWVAFMVRPHGAPPLPDDKRAEAERERAEAAEILRREFGLEMNPGPIGIDTYDAHLIMAHATRTGKGPVLLQALMRAYWLEARSIDDLAVIKEVAVSAGLEPDEVLYALEDPKNAHHVERGMEIGVGHGIHSVPSHIFASKYLVTGSADYAALQQTVNTLKEELRKAG